MKIISKWLLIAAMAWCAPALAIDQAALEALLEDARIQMKMPGVRAAVRLADGRVVRAAVGLADVEANTPLDDTIGMPGGSTGKTFVAALAMLLVEDGTLSLDDPASKWLADAPWYKKLPNADEILLRHLLSHSAGIRDYPDTMRFQLSLVGRVLRRGSARFEPEELIGFVTGRKPLYPAGQGYQYTDAGYLVLGRLIEAASGRRYYDLLDERILAPQQLEQVRAQDQSILPDITPGYTGRTRNLKKDGRMKFDPSSEWTGGGLTTNPTMLVQFYAALAEGRIVKPESLAQMLDAGWRNPDDPGHHYGFGLFVDDDGEWFGHGGTWPGYRTHVTHYVKTGTTVAVQTNRDGRLDMVALVTRIAALVPSGGNVFANEALVVAALDRTEIVVTYDPAYVVMPYPNGDVPDDTGVCTDLVVRAYRAIGLDLQQLVHEDISANFDAYPSRWGQRRPDTNIDHRRVPNLETFFARNGRGLPLSQDPDDYKPGDIVTWRLPGDLPHIGIVSNVLVKGTLRPMIVHNIGNGPKHEDMLFDYEMYGHYRYGD